MRIARTTVAAGAFFAVAIAVNVLFAVPGYGQGCTPQQGNNAVYGTCNSSITTFGSTAFIDASAFSGSATDFCAVINHIYTTSGLIPASGAVIDARGLNGGNTSMTCAASPWNGVTSPPPTTVLLPAAGPSAAIVIAQTWALPNRTRLVGEGKLTTVIQPTSSFTGDLIDMGVSCPTGGCSGISVEQIELGFPGNTYSGTNTNNGIVNASAQNNSYVDNVSISNLGGVGLSVTAANSGPYTNLAYGTNQGASGCGTSCPVCVSIRASTRGLHGITCSGSSATAGQESPNAAAIQVQASGNSIADVHNEGFWDGIQIGAAGSTTTIGGILVSNITSGNSGSGGGAVTNSVHICGTHPNTTVCTAGGSFTFGSCSSSLNAAVTDVTALDILNANGLCAATIEDDVTGTTISPINNNLTGSAGAFAALYALGELVTGVGYARLSSNPSITGTDDATSVPTWAAGNGVPSGSCPTGAIYSNTAGNKSVYACVAGAWSPVI